MGKIVGFKHGPSSVDHVDQRLWDIVQHAIAVIPYNAQIRSGSERKGGKGNHKHGYAVDVTLIDRDGNVLPDTVSKNNGATFGAYEQYAQAARVYQQAQYPELDKVFRWGGGFRQGGTPGDLMHLDITPSMGGAMAVYSWDKGLGYDYRGNQAAVPASFGEAASNGGLTDSRVRHQIELAHQNVGTVLPPLGMPGDAPQPLPRPASLSVPSAAPRPFPTSRLEALMPRQAMYGAQPGGPAPEEMTPGQRNFTTGGLDSRQHWGGMAAYDPATRRIEAPEIGDALRTALAPKVAALPMGPSDRRPPPVPPVSAPSLNDTRREQNTTYRQAPAAVPAPTVPRALPALPAPPPAVVQQASAPVPLPRLNPMTAPGNIDLDSRQVYRGDDGSIRTENSISIGTDQGEVLIPTIVNGQQLTDDQAIEHYNRTGENLGTFRTPGDADNYAQQLHQRQERTYGAPASATPPTPLTPSPMLRAPEQAPALPQQAAPVPLPRLPRPASAPAAPQPAAPRADVPAATREPEAELVRLPSGKMAKVGTYPNPTTGNLITVSRGADGRGVVQTHRKGFVDIASEMNAPTILGGIIRSKIPEVVEDAASSFVPTVQNAATSAIEKVTQAPAVQGLGNTIGNAFAGLKGLFPSAGQQQPQQQAPQPLPLPRVAPMPLMPSLLLRAQAQQIAPMPLPRLNRAIPAPLRRITPSEGNRQINGIDIAFMPKSVQTSSRWNDGY